MLWYNVIKYVSNLHTGQQTRYYKSCSCNCKQLCLKAFNWDKDGYENAYRVIEWVPLNLKTVNIHQLSTGSVRYSPSLQTIWLGAPTFNTCCFRSAAEFMRSQFCAPASMNLGVFRTAFSLGAYKQVSRLCYRSHPSTQTKLVDSVVCMSSCSES